MTPNFVLIHDTQLPTTAGCRLPAADPTPVYRLFPIIVFVSPPSSDTDAHLLQRIENDDQEAFKLIYERYWEGLLIMASMAIRNKEDAADIVQEVFMSLWKRRKELDIKGSLKAYLDTSIRYTAIHYIEKNITRRDYLALLQEMALHYLPADAELQLQLKELKETIEKVVGDMPPKMQEVYRLSRQDMLSHKEIAARMNISEETVKKHIQHALDQVRTKLGNTLTQLAILLFGYLVK